MMNMLKRKLPSPSTPSKLIHIQGRQEHIPLPWTKRERDQKIYGKNHDREDKLAFREAAAVWRGKEARKLDKEGNEENIQHVAEVREPRAEHVGHCS